jgi:branched-chain amino acid transport system substrate-binding protein
MKKLFFSFIFFFAAPSLFSETPILKTNTPGELRVGVLATLTGNAAQWGKHARQGLELAEKELNGRGGVGGNKVKLFFEDFGNFDLKKALSAARYQVEVKKVDAFFPSFIEDSEVVVPLFTQKKIFSIAMGCGGMTCAGKIGPYHIRSTSNDMPLVNTLIDQAKKRGAKKFCVITSDGSYYLPYSQAAHQMLKEQKFLVSPLSTVSWGEKDLLPQATFVKREACDAVLPWLDHGALGPFLRRMRELGITAQVYGPPYTADDSILSVAGSAVEGSLFAKFNTGTPEFTAAYQAAYGEKPERPAATAYDALMIFAHAVEKVGLDAGALRKEIVEKKDYQGVSGKFEYSSGGERKGEQVELYEISKGKLIQLSE